MAQVSLKSYETDIRDLIEAGDFDQAMDIGQHILQYYPKHLQTYAFLGESCLGAELYRPFASNLTGVDVSPKMLARAEEKKVYDRLEVFDVLQDWDFPEQFDLIYSSDVFVYFGNLDTIIKSASASLANGGVMAFSVERLADDSTEEYQLFPSGRYAHSRTYLQECLQRHGLQINEESKADIRKQSGKQVKGLLIVAQKTD